MNQNQSAPGPSAGRDLSIAREIIQLMTLDNTALGYALEFVFMDQAHQYANELLRR
jgi:hypothetical protein